MGWDVLESSDGRGAFFCNTGNEAFGPVARADLLREVGQLLAKKGVDPRDVDPWKLHRLVHEHALAKIKRLVVVDEDGNVVEEMSLMTPGERCCDGFGNA